MNTDTVHRHIDAGELIRLLDGELVAADHAAAEQALAMCDVCRAHAARLRQRTARLTTRLIEADWTAPPAAQALARLEAERLRRRATRRWSVAQQPRLRLAAAIALIVLAGALMVTPAAAWIGRALERAWHALTTPDRPRDDVSAPQAPGAPQQLQEVLERRSFAPAAGAFIVRFVHVEDAVVELTAGTDTLLVAQVLGAPVTEVLQEPRELRIDNPRGAGRSYRITVPRQVSEVRLIVGTAAPVVLTRAELAVGVTRSLRGAP
jgi:hypothetical protein